MDLTTKRSFEAGEIALILVELEDKKLKDNKNNELTIAHRFKRKGFVDWTWIKDQKVRLGSSADSVKMTI